MKTPRLVADRFRRIWGIVTVVADEPGHTRRELAGRFFLSERQVQADLKIIKRDMGLPLVRARGYRFAGEGTASGDAALSLREAHMLVMVLRHALRARVVASEPLHDLIAKLPVLFPPHLQPLISLTLTALTRAPGRDAHIFEALSDGLLKGSLVKLHAATGAPWFTTEEGREAIVRPELLVPYLGSWFVIGETPARTEGYPSRMRMLCLDEVEAVTLAAAP